jgi:hypothetical protein
MFLLKAKLFVWRRTIRVQIITIFHQTEVLSEAAIAIAAEEVVDTATAIVIVDIMIEAVVVTLREIVELLVTAVVTDVMIMIVDQSEFFFVVEPFFFTELIVFLSCHK